MEVHIYSSINGKSKAGNISQRYNGNILLAKAKRKAAGGLKNLPENSAEGLGFSRERCWVT